MSRAAGVQRWGGLPPQAGAGTTLLLALTICLFGAVAWAQTPCLVDSVTDAPSFNVSTSYGTANDPITWTHTVTAEMLASATQAGLLVEAYDIDYPSSTEYDRLYVNGHDLGLLQGVSDTWVVAEKTVPLAYLQEGANTIQVYVDINNEGWVTQVRASELRIYCSFTVSGTVTDGSDPLVGAQVSFSHNGHTETTNASGQYSYDILNGVNTTITVTYPGAIAWTPSSRNITVSGATSNQNFVATFNQAPVIQQTGPLAVTMSEDGSPTAWSAPTLSATDGNGHTLTWSVSSAASHGTATVSGTGASPPTFNYAPTANWYGSDSFVVQVSDSYDTDTITVNVTVESVNDSPTVGTNAGVTVGEGDTATIGTSELNESDPDDSGTGLTYTVTGAPSNGALKLSGNPTSTFTQDDIDNDRVTYTHDGGETTTDSFDFSLADGGEDGASATTGTFDITVTPENDPPSLAMSSGTASFTEDGGAIIVDPTLTITDPDGGDTLDGASVIIDSGFVSSEDALSFTSQHGVTGTYNSSTGVLTLSGSATPAEYQDVLRSVTYNNTNGGAPDLTDRSIVFVLGSSLFFSENGHFYEFVTTGGINWSSAKTAAEGRTYFGMQGYLVTVTSEAENSFTTAKLSGEGWIGAADATVEGTWRWVTGPEGLEDGGNGRHFFTQTSSQLGTFYGGATPGGGYAMDGYYNGWASGEPNDWADAEDCAHYYSSGTWNDYAGGTSVAGYVVEYGGMPGDPDVQVAGSRVVEVTAQNDAPVITQGAGPLSVTMSEDGAPTPWSAPTLGATDVDGVDTLTWSVSSAASHGTATVSGTGGSPPTFTYAPTGNYNGSDSFTVQVADGNGGNDTIAVNVTVQAVNDAPVITQGAGPLTVTMSEDDSPTAWSAPTVGATDVDTGTALTWSVSSAASHGTATVSGTGASPTTFTYVPVWNWNGSDSFTVQVADGNGGNDTIAVNVTVQAVNDAPVITQGAGPLTVTMSEDGSPTAWSTPPVGATDVDTGDTLTWSVSSAASHGTATVSGTGASPPTFTYAPDGDWNGSDSFTVQVSDGTVADTISVEVTVEAVQDAPVITQGAGPLTVTMSEDGAPTAWSAPTLDATDADTGAALTWSVLSAASHGTATVSGTGGSPTTFTYAPEENWNGTDSFTVQVSDGTDADTIAVDVTVEAVNDAPVLDPIGNQEVHEGGTLTFVIAGTDVEEDGLSYSASNLPTGATFNPATQTFTWATGYGDSGVYTNVLFTVTDDGTPPRSDSETITLTVGEVNRPPVLYSVGDRDVAEGATLTFTITGADLDADGLTYSASNLPTGAAFDPATQTFSWTTGYGDAGVYTNVLFTVTDDGTPPQSDSEAITLTVGDVNRAPVLDPIGSREVAEAATLSFLVTGSDPDGNSLTYSASNLPTGATFDPATQTFSWTTGYGDAGVYTNVLFSVTDDGTPSRSDSEAVTVTVGDVNRPPVFDPIGDREVAEGAALTFVVTGSDPDGDVLTYSASNLPTGATFDATTQRFTWVTDYGDAGVYLNILLTVRDDGTPSQSDTERVNVTVGDVNRLPVLDPIGDREVAEGATLTFVVTGSDPDGDVLTYSASNLPTGATFDATTQRFTWATDYGDAGVYANVLFSVTDDGTPLQSDSEAVTLTVGDVNRPPALAPIGSREVPEGTTLTFVVTASDPDRDALTYSASNLPSGADFDAATGRFTWATDYGDAGVYTNVLFTVRDDGTPSRSDSEAINLAVGDVNRPPVLDPIGNREVAEGATLSIVVTGSDPDGDALTYGASNLPPGADFDAATQTFTWAAGFGDAGVYANVIFTATDDGTPPQSDTESVTITVGNVNRAPELELIGSREVAEGATLTFVVSGSDPDGNALTYSASNLPTGAAFYPATQIFTWSTDFGDAGVYTDVLFTVEDDGTPSQSDSENVTIIVGDVNRPPVLAPIGSRVVDEGTTLTFVVTASDPDADALTYSASNLPTGATFDPATQRFTWAINHSDAGAYTGVLFTVEDGGTPSQSDSESIVIVVNNVAATLVLLEGPIVSSISDTSASVEWTTSIPADSEVSYGLSEAALQTGSDAALVTNHVFDILGLQPDTEYIVSVASSDGAAKYRVQSPFVRFRTLPVADMMPPVILRGPTVINLTETEVLVVWTTDEPSTSSVFLDDGSLQSWVDDSELVTEHALRVIDVLPDTLYSIKVASTDASGNGPTESALLSHATAAEPDLTPPDITEGPVVTRSDQELLTLHWLTDEPATSVVTYGLDETLGSEVADEALTTEHNVSVVGLASDTPYYFRVSSMDASGNGPVVSPIVMAIPQSEVDATAPVITDGPRVIGVTDTTATLYWETDELSDSVVDYDIAEPLGQRRSVLRHVYRHQVTLVNLLPGQEYLYQVSSTDIAGNTATADGVAKQSSVFTFQTNSDPDVEAPAITSGPEILEITDTTAIVVWDTSEVADSVVEYAVAGSSAILSRTDPFYVTEHLVVLTALAPETPYEVWVLSSDLAGNGPAVSGVLSFTTDAGPDATAPVFVSGPVVEDLSRTSATVRWTTDKRTTSQVEFGPSSGIVSKVASTTGLHVTHEIELTNLTPNTEYTCVVTSFDVSQNMVASSAQTFQTRARDTDGGGGAILGLGLAGAGITAALLVGGHDDGGGGGPCFIATAAYGTPLASDLDVLRGLRDHYLLTNGAGTALVDTYYRLSPPIADFIAVHPAAGALVRLLCRLVILAAHTPRWVIDAAVVALAIGVAASMARRRRLNAQSR